MSESEVIGLPQRAPDGVTVIVRTPRRNLNVTLRSADDARGSACSLNPGHGATQLGDALEGAAPQASRPRELRGELMVRKP